MMANRTIAVRAICAVALLAVACGETVEGRRDHIYKLKADPTTENIVLIRELIEDENDEVRATALHALVELAVPDAGELAVAGLADPDGWVRQTAAHALKAVGDERAVAPLADTLAEDEDYVVRQKAASALTAIATGDAIAALVVALEDPIKEVRLAAVRGVVKLDPEFAVDAMVTMVLQDPDWEIRVQAAAALGLSSHDEIIPILEEAANDPNEFVRAAVARALKRKGLSGPSEDSP